MLFVLCIYRLVFIGKMAVNKLLRRSTFAYNEDGTFNYVRLGGPENAIDDFKSVEPTKVIDFQGVSIAMQRRNELSGVGISF